MFRSVVLSIVLTLAAGQNAAMFCGVWCHSGEGIAGTCEHQVGITSPSGIVVNDGCYVNSDSIVFVGENARRGTSASEVQGGVLVPWFVLALSSLDIRSHEEPDPRLLLKLRVLALPLRI
jgi:hypothetical protein